jgi:hypothetical protein
MKKTIFLFLSVIAIFALFQTTEAISQNKPVLYFCEKYDADRGEIGQSSTFTTGFLTVMVKDDKPLGLTGVTIQFDKYDIYTETFTFYKKFNYTVTPDMKYIFFAGKDLSFDEAGVFRVYLLDEKGKTVTAAIVIIKS